MVDAVTMQSMGIDKIVTLFSLRQFPSSDVRHSQVKNTWKQGIAGRGFNKNKKNVCLHTLKNIYILTNEKIKIKNKSILWCIIALPNKRVNYKNTHNGAWSLQVGKYGTNFIKRFLYLIRPEYCDVAWASFWKRNKQKGVRYVFVHPIFYIFYPLSVAYAICLSGFFKIK